ALLTTLYHPPSSKKASKTAKTAAGAGASSAPTEMAAPRRAPQKKLLKKPAPKAPPAEAAAAGTGPDLEESAPAPGPVKEPSLVVAPTSVIAAWIQKLKKYDTGLKWHVFHGSGRTLPAKGVDIVLTTYGILHREPELRERQWHVVILDEAQAIKNASTISSRASRMLKSRFRIAMTGTPVENQATDLWSLMEFLLPGYLGSLPRFKRLYGWGREVPTDLQADALKRLVSPFLLRRTKAKVLKELPEKIEEVVHCEMTATQRKAYRECLSGAEASQVRANIVAGQKIDYANVLALLTRLKQICDHPKLADLTSGKIKKAGSVDPAETGKWETFDELLNEALGSELKVVVFTQYLGMIDLISHHLRTSGVGYTELRGDTPDRGARLERFSQDPECRVFLCSLLAGGLGIDLTSASVCIHFDRWWNPAKENQATDRLHRFGQTRGVQVFKLQIPGTVEDRIANIIESKVQLSGALIEESSLGLKAFSRKELLELLTPDDAETAKEEAAVAVTAGRPQPRD
ncbi:MAG: DEAD/DEAH box helicase, partial [Oligoflexia bacterium]|nr:DEAD/DEAH box helicase [Oligoflexia bacterium]